MTRIIQIAPEIAPGSGVGGVAYELERVFHELGIDVSRFTLREAGLNSAHGSTGRLRRAGNVLWFSTVGTVRARRHLRANADAISICHNDVLAGDIYVNHGIVQLALRSRGRYLWRLLRNPLHLFTIARDRRRYRGTTHRAIVALTASEPAALRREYGRVHPPVTVIPNGIDLDRFRVPEERERATARAALGIPAGAFTAVFIGHEFERKGLHHVLAALEEAPGTRLLVVGGSPADIRQAHATARQHGVEGRISFLGTLPDPVPALRAADALVFPSSYESFGLVLLEALACGVPAISTPVGAAPELLGDGRAGRLVDADPHRIAEALQDLSGRPRDEAAAAARAVAEQYGWRRIAERYLDLVHALEHGTQGAR